MRELPLRRSGRLSGSSRPVGVLEQEVVNAAKSATDSNTNVTDVNESSFHQTLKQEAFLSFGICQAHVLFEVLFLDEFHTTLEVIDAGFERVEFISEFIEQRGEFF